MYTALLLKTWRDTRFMLLIAAVVIVGFEMLFIIAMEQSLRDMGDYLGRLPSFAKDLLRMLAGADIFENLTPTGLMSVGFSHPFMHVVVWSFCTAYCTRVLAGEIDHGTADVLFSLPLRRAGIFACLVAVSLLCGLILSAAPWVGTWLGQHALGKGPFDLPRLAMVSVNFFLLFAAISGGSLACSAAMSQRGRAVGFIIGVLLGSFLLNFLAAMWPTARRIAFLGVLDYFQPLPIIAGGEWPIRNMVVLATAAVVSWTGGLVILARRDIRTG